MHLENGGGLREKVNEIFEKTASVLAKVNEISWLLMDAMPSLALLYIYAVPQ